MPLGILFPGQGAQRPGMGRGFAEASRHLEKASAVLGYDLGEVLDDPVRLGETRYVQPAIVAASLIPYRQLVAETGLVPAAFLGFSLGEWSALGAAGVLPDDTLYRLVGIRAEAMQEAARKRPGAMAAVLGLDVEPLSALCAQASETDDGVWIANLNCPGQTVVSGTVEAVRRLATLAGAAGARRVVPLAVSGAFHTPMMASAAARMAEALADAEFGEPSAPVWSNVTGRATVCGSERELLSRQIVEPVRFEAAVRDAIAGGIDAFLEVGPGTVLSGFVRKIAPGIPLAALGEPADLELVKGWIQEHGNRA